MKKTDKRLYAGIGIALAFALVFAFSASAEFSIMDRLLQIAGQTWGNKLPVPDMGDITLGAFPGGDIYNDVSIHGSFQSGANLGCLATSTSGAGGVILTEQQMLDYSCFEMTSHVAQAYTMTLPATSTWISLLGDPGDKREWMFHNATSSTMALTIVAGAGIDLVSVTTDDDIIDATEYALVTCTRLVATSTAGTAHNDAVCVTRELVHSD